MKAGDASAMTTDSGLGYLSGLLRAGAEPLGPAGRAPRRRARVPQHQPTSHHADTNEVPQPLQDDAPEHAAHVSANERHDPAEQTLHTNSAQTIHTNSAQTIPADSGSTIHTNPASIIPADSASTVHAKGPEVSDAVHTAPPNAPLGDAAVERAAEVAAQPPASPHTHTSSALSPDEAAAVEHQSHEKSQGLTSATNHATRAASRRRAASSVEKRGGETERTAIVTNERVNTSSTSGQPDAEAPPAQFQTNTEAPLTRSQAETVAPAAPRIEVASTEVAAAAEDMTTGDMTTAHATSVADNVLPARAAARREQPARVVHTPPQVRPPQRRESDLTSAGESDAAREAEGANGDADATPYTLEEHIGQLRSIMQTRHTEIPDELGVEPAPTAMRHRATPTRRQSGKNDDGARDAATVASPTTRGRRERGKTLEAGLVPARDSDELNPESAVTPRAGTSPAPTDVNRVEVLKQPLKVTPTRGHARPARLAGVPGTTNERPDMSEPPSTNERAVVPHVAANARASANAPTKQSGRAGEVNMSGARVPKLTINRLDVQVVNRSEPTTTPSPPAPPAPVQPSQPDPWDAPDRQFLGRFFY